MGNCLNCSSALEGRRDKKFCDAYCKSAYHYKEKQKNQDAFYKHVDLHLKLNRRLLKAYNLAGKSIVRKSILIRDGFCPDFFTHYWKNKRGEVYLFVYEFGFLRVKQNGREKFVLVKWQGYMDNKR